MEDIKQVRVLTGLSHRAIAEWLGVSKGLLQFVEKGQRSLPTEAHLKMVAMLSFCDGVKDRALAREEKPGIINPGRLAAEHRKKIELYERNAAALKRKLSRLKQVHPQLNSRMALLDVMKNSSTETYHANENDKKWIDFAEWLSNERLPRTGLEEQELLEDKIETYLAYAELHKKRAERYEGMGE